MKTSIVNLLSASVALASPLSYTGNRVSLMSREVPQEHSHEIFLTLTREALAKNNPKNIKDVVFGLLGNGAAAAGAGSVSNLDCLHQETADQAFTNAKAAGDIRLMSAALVFQTLERNTLKVGLASAACKDTAVNPEIAALTQHQDPSSANAASVNKEITLELARQLKSIGGDPNLALMSGTFTPGDVSSMLILYFPFYANRLSRQRTPRARVTHATMATTTVASLNRVVLF